MNKPYTSFAKLLTLSLAVSMSLSAFSQAFRQGSFCMSASEGSTFSNYSTSSDINPRAGSSRLFCGNRDPLIFEYGLTNHWGIGSSFGTDLFNVDPSAFYGLKSSTATAKVTTSEVGLDLSYHFLVSKHTDLSAMVSVGTTSVSMKGTDGETAYQYSASGFVYRTGVRARYYVCKRFNFFGMISSYTTNYSSDNVKGNTVAGNYVTSISGYAYELGFGYKFCR